MKELDRKPRPINKWRKDIAEILKETLPGVKDNADYGEISVGTVRIALDFGRYVSRDDRSAALFRITVHPGYVYNAHDRRIRRQTFEVHEGFTLDKVVARVKLMLELLGEAERLSQERAAREKAQYDARKRTAEEFHAALKAAELHGGPVDWEARSDGTIKIEARFTNLDVPRAVKIMAAITKLMEGEE